MNGRKLRDLREENNTLQKELGSDLGISSNTVSAYELGTREPDLLTIKKIANHFHVSVDYLLDNENSDFSKETTIKRNEVLKSILVEYGFMNKKEKLTDSMVDRMMRFLTNNKDLIKNYNR